MVIKSLPTTKILLDAGCGWGSHSKGFEKKTSWLIGLDIAKGNILEYRKSLGNLASCIVASLDYLPLRPGSVDACVLQDCLEHTKNPLNVLDQIRYIIRRNGTVLATVPNWYNRLLIVSSSNVKTHQYFSSSVGWQKLFRKAGFLACSVSCVGFPILDTQFLSKNLHILGVSVMLKARKTD